MPARGGTLIMLIAAALLSLIAGEMRRSAATLVVSPAISMERMVASAPLIVLGRVEVTSARWVGRRIVTRGEVSVERTLKGVPGERVVIEVPGGTVGDIGMRVIGAPILAKGDRAIFFLTGGDSRRIVGWAAGKWDVAPDVDGNDRVGGWPLEIVVDGLSAVASSENRTNNANQSSH